MVEIETLGLIGAPQQKGISMGDAILAGLFVLAVAMMTYLPLRSHTKEAALVGVFTSFFVVLFVRWAAGEGSDLAWWLNTEFANRSILITASAGVLVSELRPPTVIDENK